MKLDILLDEVVPLAGGRETETGTRLLEAGSLPAGSLVLAVRVSPQQAPAWISEPTGIRPGFITPSPKGDTFSQSVPSLAPADLAGNEDRFAYEMLVCPNGAQVVLVLQDIVTPEASAGSVRIVVHGVSLSD